MKENKDMTDEKYYKDFLDSIFKITDLKNVTDYDEYLKDLDTFMWYDHVYKRYNQNLHGEKYAYWKVFKDSDGNKLYQIGLLVYDFREYNLEVKISTEYRCMVLDDGDDRLEMICSKDIELREFEKMSESFYNEMKKYK